jgi:ATP-dependent DNA helicase RecQ
VIDVLRGKVTDKVTRFGHQRLSTFGIGADRSEAEGRLLLRHLVAQHVVDVDHAHFNVLRLAEASRAVLRGEARIELRMQAQEPRRRTKRRTAIDGLDTSAEPLFERLREWRAGVAREHGVPAYVVFHDGTLRAIAQQRPRALEELAQVSGVGTAKLARYGEAVIGIVSAG